MLSGVAQAQAEFPPVDEASSDQTFVTFRAEGLDAIARRDGAFILSILTKDIRNSFGGDGGIAEFESTWKLDSEESRFWTEFETVIRLGGAARSTTERHSCGSAMNGCCNFSPPAIEPALTGASGTFRATAA